MALKYFYYVLALSEGQAKFVTQTDYTTKTAYWDSNEKSLAFTKTQADDLALFSHFDRTGFVRTKKFLENFSNFFENKKRPHNPLGDYTIFLFHYLLVKAFQLIFLCMAIIFSSREPPSTILITPMG